MYPNIRAEIARKRLTLAELAKEMNIAPQTLSGKLTGRHDFQFSEAAKLKDILGYEGTLEELFEVD